MHIGIIDATKEETHGRRRTREALESRGVHVVVIDPCDVTFEFSSTRGIAWLGDVQLDQVLDACLIRRTRGAVAQVVELVHFLSHQGIPCVDPPEAFVSPLSKTGTMMNAAGSIQIPHTLIVNNLDSLHAADWNTFPCIVKPLEGMGGVGVQLAQNTEEMREQVTGLLAQDWRVMVQEHIDIQDEYRVVVIGDKAIASFRKLALPGSVTRNVTQGASFEQVHRPDLETAAIEATRRNHCKICGVDIVEAATGIYLLEANRCPAFEEAERCGVDVADAIADYLYQVAASNKGDS